MGWNFQLSIGWVSLDLPPSAEQRMTMDKTGSRTEQYDQSDTNKHGGQHGQNLADGTLCAPPWSGLGLLTAHWGATQSAAYPAIARAAMIAIDHFREKF